jgi:hypothetical protein
VATEWLDDAFGPDAVRVTVAVEPAVERMVRIRDDWLIPRWYWTPNKSWVRRLMPGFVQKELLHDDWAVMVESDSGQKLRLIRPTRDTAWELASSIAAAVRDRGIPALADFRVAAD